MPANNLNLKSAFRRFVDLVKPIDEVYCVTAVEPSRPDFFTYIRQRNDEVVRQIFQAEKAVNKEFPDVLIDYHIIFLEGRPLEDFVTHQPEFTYLKKGLRSKELKRGVEG